MSRQDFISGRAVAETVILGETRKALVDNLYRQQTWQDFQILQKTQDNSSSFATSCMLLTLTEVRQNQVYFRLLVQPDCRQST